jgi:glutamate dehydrogenase
MEEVMVGIEQRGFMPGDLVESETKWFYEQLGIDDMYFATETVEA